MLCYTSTYGPYFMTASVFSSLAAILGDTTNAAWIPPGNSRIRTYELTKSLYACYCRFHLIIATLMISFPSSQWKSFRYFWPENFLHNGFKSWDHKLNCRSDRQVYESDYRQYGHYGHCHRVHSERHDLYLADEIVCYHSCIL